MPRLILLNGPPACGKSTLAQRYVDEHPLALNLDIDRLRSLIGRWRDDPHAAGPLARAVALAAARAHLASELESDRALARGFLEYSLAMLFRAGWTSNHSTQAELITAGHRLARTVVR